MPDTGRKDFCKIWKTILRHVSSSRKLTSTVLNGKSAVLKQWWWWWNKRTMFVVFLSFSRLCVRQSFSWRLLSSNFILYDFGSNKIPERKRQEVEKDARVLSFGVGKELKLMPAIMIIIIFNVVLLHENRR